MVLLRITILHRFTVHSSVLVSFFSLFSGWCQSRCLWVVLAAPRLTLTLLPDNAEVACRAILPLCFRRSDWAELCARDPGVAVGHPEACRAAGFE